MPTARASRTIAAPAQELWELVRDPHHLPRWWPRVTRVEDVSDDAFTEVMRTKKGRTVRADFNVVSADESVHALRWEQLVEGTPFARVLVSAQTDVRLEALAGAAGAAFGSAAGTRAATAGPATRVTLELRQAFAGVYPRVGGFMLRRAASATLRQALDGLERISG